MIPAALALLLSCQDKADTGLYAPPGSDSQDSRPTESGDSSPGETAESGESGESGEPAGQLWEGQRADEGFGSALAWDGVSLFAGAPWGGGRVYQLSPGGEVAVAMEESGQGALGISLAFDSAGALWAGAPLSGEGGLLRSAGAEVAGGAGEVLGSRLLSTPGGLAATTSAGFRLGSELTDLGARPGGLAFVQGALAVGLPRGDAALWIDGASLSRAEPLDEAGYALCAADLDGDGLEYMELGSTVINTIYLLFGDKSGWDLSTAPRLTGEGRLGHALACAPGLLFAGAPMSGPDLSGAVYAFEAPTGGESGALWMEGSLEGEQLGAALLWTGELLYAGAPGAADGPGRVYPIEAPD